jgi:hypothetical protein
VRVLAEERAHAIRKRAWKPTQANERHDDSREVVSDAIAIAIVQGLHRKLTAKGADLRWRVQAAAADRPLSRRRNDGVVRDARSGGCVSGHQCDVQRGRRRNCRIGQQWGSQVDQHGPTWTALATRWSLAEAKQSSDTWAWTAKRCSTPDEQMQRGSDGCAACQALWVAPHQHLVGASEAQRMTARYNRATNLVNIADTAAQRMFVVDQLINRDNWFRGRGRCRGRGR